MSIELNKESVEQADSSSCQGTNCGTTTGDHSSECLAEAAAGQGWELKPGDLCGRDCPIHKISVEQAGGDERATLAHRSEFHQHLKECADEVATWPSYKREALTQPSPAPELERPEVVAYLFVKPDGTLSMDAVRHKPSQPAVAVMTVAQHERIVGELRADRDSWAEQAEQRLADWDEMRKERDAALARVAELEKQEPVATVAKVPGEDWNSLDFHRDLQDMQPGTKLYAAPVAQAQQLKDLDKQCRDDVARALGLRPNQERGFAWSYLLASIKSCVKASGDSAQAQHSVPGDIMRDAQRYRWLRDQQFYFSFSTENSDAGISSCTAGMSSRFKNLSWVDAAIDSAIAAAPGKEGV